jgi:hypothetical protein
LIGAVIAVNSVTMSLAEQTRARRQPNALPCIFPVMCTNDQPSRSIAEIEGAYAGANSLESVIAEHLAFCAVSLLRAGRRREAGFALAEARRVQTQALQRAALATRTEIEHPGGWIS